MPEETRSAPYPADTRAKGWRFELDYEAIEQSDTWPLAAEIPMAQHALLMMWLVAWKQVPCGAFPNDEAVIRAKCRIPQGTWLKCREVLMRGWWPGDDGRLYHDTLTKRVMEMMARRRSDSDRQAAKRAREAAEAAVTHAGITPVSRVTPPALTPESSTDNRQPNTEKEYPPKPPRKRRGAAAQLVSLEQLVSEGVTQQHAEDWLTVRTKKGLALTPTAWDEVKAQAVKAGLSTDEAIKTAAANSWGGFKAKWLVEDAARGANPRDVAGITVPGSKAPDPALLKIAEDQKRAVPPSAQVREQLKTLARKEAVA